METIQHRELFSLAPEDNRRLFELCGRLNEHIHLIEKSLSVQIKQRGYHFAIQGEPKAVKQAGLILSKLYEEAKSKSLPYQIVHQHLQLAKQFHVDKSSCDHFSMEIKLKKTLIKARGENQVQYLKRILTHDINFGIGAAGTGKTYLAVASAVAALEEQRVRRIILTRPIVEAGERLGFLPGDLSQKIHPYLKPLYDALYDMLGNEKVAQLIEQNSIELAPLAYMRGRSLNEAFIILDEAQNTTPEQMKMFLTRIGFGSKVVITGDVTQIDLPKTQVSGLVQALTVLQAVPGISVTEFQVHDVIRHGLVQKVIEAYQRFEALMHAR